MIMAYWNGMQWGVSRSEVTYLESLTTAYSIDTSTNADKEGESPTETVGMSLIEIAFNTTYRIETGTSDVKGILEQWKSKIGKTGPLIIGSTVFGPDKMQLQSVNVSNIQINAKGMMRAASCAFKLKEYAEEAAGAKSVNGITDTAVSIGATSADKESKKTVNIE